MSKNKQGSASDQVQQLAPEANSEIAEKPHGQPPSVPLQGLQHDPQALRDQDRIPIMKNEFSVSQGVPVETAQKVPEFVDNQSILNQFETQDGQMEPGQTHFGGQIYSQFQNPSQMTPLQQNMFSQQQHFQQISLSHGQGMEILSSFERKGQNQPSSNRLLFEQQMRQVPGAILTDQVPQQIQAFEEPAQIIQAQQQSSVSDSGSRVQGITQQFKIQSNKIGPIQQSEQFSSGSPQKLAVPCQQQKQQQATQVSNVGASMGETSQDWQNKATENVDFVPKKKSSCGIMTEGKETQQSSEAKVAAGSDLNFVNNMNQDLMSSQYKKIPQTDQVASGQRNNSSQHTHEEYNNACGYNNIIYSESVNKFSEGHEFDPPDSLSNFPHNHNFTAQINDLLDDEDVHELNIKDPSKINLNQQVDDAESLVSSQNQANSTKQTNGSNLIQTNIQQPQRGQSSCENQPPHQRLQLKPPGTGSGGNCVISSSQPNTYFQDYLNPANVHNQMTAEQTTPHLIARSLPHSQNHVQSTLNHPGAAGNTNGGTNIRHPSMDSRQQPQQIETTRGIGVAHGIGYHQADQIIKQSTDFNKDAETIVASGRKSVYSNKELQKNNYFREEHQLQDQAQGSLVTFGNSLQQNYQNEEYFAGKQFEQNRPVAQVENNNQNLNSLYVPLPSNKDEISPLKIESPVLQNIGRSLNLSGLRSQDNFQGQRSDNTVRERRMTADEQHLLGNSSSHLDKVVQNQSSFYNYPQSAERKQDEYGKRVMTSVSEDNNQQKLQQKQHLQNQGQKLYGSLSNRYQAHFNQASNFINNNQMSYLAHLDSDNFQNQHSSTFMVNNSQKQILKDQYIQNSHRINSNRFIDEQMDQKQKYQQPISSSRILVDDPHDQQDLEYCMAEMQLLKEFNKNKLDQQVQHRIMMSQQHPQSHHQFTYRAGAPLTNQQVYQQQQQQIQQQQQQLKMPKNLSESDQMKRDNQSGLFLKQSGQIIQQSMDQNSQQSNLQLKAYQIQQEELQQHQLMVQNHYYAAHQQQPLPSQQQQQLSLEEQQAIHMQQMQQKFVQPVDQAQLIAQMNQLNIDPSKNPEYFRPILVDKVNANNQFTDQQQMAQETQQQQFQNINFYHNDFKVDEFNDGLQDQEHLQQQRNNTQFFQVQNPDGSKNFTMNKQGSFQNDQNTHQINQQDFQHAQAFYPKNIGMGYSMEQDQFQGNYQIKMTEVGNDMIQNLYLNQQMYFQEQMQSKNQFHFQNQQPITIQSNQIQQQQMLKQSNSGDIATQDLQISNPGTFKALQQMVALGQTEGASVNSVGGNRTIMKSSKTSNTDGQQASQKQQQNFGYSNDLSVNLSDQISPQKNNQTEQPNELTNVLSSSRSSQHVLSEERPESAKVGNHGGKCISQKYSARNQMNKKILGSVRGEASYGSRDNSKGIIKGATSHGAASDDGQIQISSHSHYDSQTSKEKILHSKNQAHKVSNLKGSVKTVIAKASSQKNQSDGNKRKDSINKRSSGNVVSHNVVPNDIPKYKEILQSNKLIPGSNNNNDAKSMNDKILQGKTTGCEGPTYQRKNSVKSGGNEPGSTLNLNQNLEQLNQNGSNILSTNNSNYGRKQSYSQGGSQIRNNRSSQRMQVNSQTAQANSVQHGSNQSYDEFISQIQHDIKKAKGDSEKEFNVLNGNILKIASKKVGSLFLQDYLKNADQQLINKIIDQVDGKLADLMVGKYGNFFCSRLIEYLQPHQRIHFLKQISGKKFVEISCDDKGTWALQNILHAAMLEEEYKIIEETIMRNDNISKLSKDKQGHHMINLIITSYPDGIRRQIFNYICNNFKDLAQDQNGLCVMKEIIKYAKKDVEMQKHIINNIIVDSLEYVQHEFGNFVVQEIINLYDFELCKDIYKQMEGHFYRLSLNKFSSKLIETCINRAPVQLQDQIVKEFCNSNCLSKVVQGNFGNFVLQKSIEIYLKSKHNKLELITAIINCLEDVSDYKVQDKWGHQLLVRYLNSLDTFPQLSEVNNVHESQQEYQAFLQQKRSVQMLLEQKMSEIDHQHQSHKQNIQNQMQGGKGGNFGSSQGNRGNNGNSFTSKFNNQGGKQNNSGGNNYINSKHNQKLNKQRGGGNKGIHGNKHNQQKNLQLQQQHSAQPKQQQQLPPQPQQRYSLNQIIHNDQMGNYFDGNMGPDSATGGGHLYQSYQGKYQRMQNQQIMPGYNTGASGGMLNSGTQSMNNGGMYSGEYDNENSYSMHQQFDSRQNAHGLEQSHPFGYQSMDVNQNASSNYGQFSHRRLVDDSIQQPNQNMVGIMHGRSSMGGQGGFNNSNSQFVHQLPESSNSGNQQMQYMTRGNQQKNQMRKGQFALTQQYSYRGQQQNMSSQPSHEQFYHEANQIQTSNAPNENAMPVHYQQKGKSSSNQGGPEGQISKLQKFQAHGGNGGKSGGHGGHARNQQRVSGNKKQIVKMSDITWAPKQDLSQGGEPFSNNKHNQAQQNQARAQVPAPLGNAGNGMPMQYSAQNSTPNLGCVGTSGLLPNSTTMEHAMSQQQLEQNTVPSSLFNNDPLGITPNGSSGGTTGRETENQID